MKLSDFIQANMEPILQNWEDFAKTLFPSTQQANTHTLRDHAKKMLLTISADLAQNQSGALQTAKSKGLIKNFSLENTPAEMHGQVRMSDGFSIDEMVSEFRALRASVIRLWTDRLHELKTENIKDLIRFNEAIDQTLTESVFSYSLLKEQEVRLLNAMLSSSHDLSYVLDLAGRFVYANKAVVELYQTQHSTTETIIGKAVENFILPSRQDIQKDIELIIATGQYCRGEILYQNIHGNDFYYEYILSPVKNLHGMVEAVAGTSRDITQRKYKESQLLQSAYHDSLTGLSNRQMFLEKLTEALDHSEKNATTFALLFLDIDEFKAVNDNFGHETGDLLLTEISKVIKKQIQDTDIAARLGGDEFTIILNEVTEIDKVNEIAKNLLIALKQPFSINSHLIHISGSIGIAFDALDARSPETMLRKADRAMYLAKKAGGNQFNIYGET